MNILSSMLAEFSFSTSRIPGEKRKTQTLIVVENRVKQIGVQVLEKDIASLEEKRKMRSERKKRRIKAARKRRCYIEYGRALHRTRSSATREVNVHVHEIDQDLLHDPPDMTEMYIGRGIVKMQVFRNVKVA